MMNELMFHLNQELRFSFQQIKDAKGQVQYREQAIIHLNNMKVRVVDLFDLFVLKS